MLAEWDAVAGGVIGAVVTGLIALLAFFRKGKRQDERTAINYYRRALDEEREARAKEREEMRGQLDLHAGQMADAQRAIDLLRDAGRDCEVGQEALWGVAVRQHDFAVRQHNCCLRTFSALRKLGQEPGDDPDPPPPLGDRPRYGAKKDAAEFAARTAEQGAAALGELDARTKESRP
jgi:hypothetical protein